MIDFTAKLKLWPRPAKQARSQRTQQDLLQAAEALVDAADPREFNSRALAARSGYGLGTINRRFDALDNVFLWVILRGRERHLRAFGRMIDAFDPLLPLSALAERLVDAFFAEVRRVNPHVIRFFEARALRRMAAPWEHLHYVDALAPHLLAAAQRDRTGSFRPMNADEMRLVLRAALMVLERPFVELDPVAGTDWHRGVAVAHLVRLLGN